MPNLTDTERKMFAIERTVYGRAWGLKESRVRDELGLTLTAYYQRLNALLADPRVEECAPLEVRRLRRLRDGRLAVRRAAKGNGAFRC